MKSMQEMLPMDDSLKIRCFRRSGNMNTEVTCTHWHGETEIVLSNRGSGVQHINESSFVLEPSHMAVIALNQLHTFAACSKDEELDLLVLQFDAAAFLADHGPDDRFTGDWLAGRPFFPGPVPVTPEIRCLLDHICMELERKSEGYRQYVSGGIRQLLVLLYRIYHVQFIAEGKTEYQRATNTALVKVFEWIKDRYSQEGLSPMDAAREANMSGSHFSRMFKASTGMTFHQYLNYYRVVRAHQMIRSGKPILDTALSVGFGSLSAFCRNYRKFRSISPSRDHR